MAVTLYLIRHGETEENAAGILQGHLPGHLSEHGKQQIRQQEAALRHIPFDCIWCSDLQRCRDTAALLNEKRRLPVHYTALLRERDWGPFTGRQLLKERIQIDHRAESAESMYLRAEQILNRWSDEEEGHCLLVVSHGLFCRVLQGVVEGKHIHKIPRMENAEVRMLRLTGRVRSLYRDDTDGATDR